MKKKKGGGTTGAEDERRRTETKTKTKTKSKEKCDGDEAAAVVLRMELHCDGCALKVRKAIKDAQGAERVRTDVAAGTVTVAGNGKADPWDLRDRIQARMARHKPSIDIAFVTPPNPPRPPPKPNKQQPQGRRWSIINKNKHDGDANNNKGNGRHDKQMPPPPESTVVLNIQLHCKGCTDRIKRKANNIKGVKQVTVDTAKEQVTVKGTMDAKALPDVLSAKLKRRVTAVAVPPTMTSKNNKDKKAAAGPNDRDDDNREQGEEADGVTTAGGAKKKSKNWRKQRGEAAAVAGDGEMASWMPEQQQYPMTIFPASYGRGGGSVGSSYRADLLQGPQPFSDENPNACSLM